MRTETNFVGSLIMSIPSPLAVYLLPRLYLGFVDWLYGGPTRPELEGHGHGA